MPQDQGFQTAFSQPSAVPQPTTNTPVGSSTQPPLSFDQFQQLRQKGLSVDQITKFNSGQTPVSNNSTTPASPPGFFSRLGSDLANGSVGQEISGIAKGIGSTVSGLSTMGQNTLGALTDFGSHLIGQPSVPRTPTANDKFGTALTPQGGWQNVGYGLEKAGELLTPTPEIAATKDLMSGVDAAKLAKNIPVVGENIAKGINAIKDVPYAGKALSYVSQKVLNAIPEGAFGTVYGLSQGEKPEEAAKTGATFGALSGLGEVVGDTWRAVKGGVADNINKALGATGKMTPQQALDKVPKSLSAFQTMANLADDIKVKTLDGVEKAWEPTKDGFYEGLQALQQSKKQVYDAYTELATKAGGKGAKFTAEDFNSVVDKIAGEGKDATGGFKGKAASLIDDLKDNFGKFTRKGEFKGFVDTDLKRIQSFIEKVNTDVNPLSDKAGATVSDTASKALRSAMDKKIEDATFLSDIEEKKLPGQKSPYQKLRNSYGDLKSIENDMINQLKKSYRGVGGRVGQYVEGFGSLDTLLGALSHNPIEMAKGIGTASIGKVMNYLRDPEVGLQNAFEQLTDKESSALKTRAIGKASAPSIKK